jgi:hypothetical protein
MAVGRVPSSKPLVALKPVAEVGAKTPAATKPPVQTVESATAGPVKLDGASATQAAQVAPGSRKDGDWLGGVQSSQQLIASMKDAKSPRVAIYQESLKRSSPEALATQRYGDPIGPDALKKLSALGKPFADLIADPGVVMRVDDFVAFASKLDVSKMGAWDLREAYSQHLGVAHVFRGLAMTKAQAEVDHRDGMPAGYLRPDMSGNAEWSKGDPFTQNVFSMMKERIHGGGWGSISTAPDQPPLDALMSVTFNRKIANDVTAGLIKQVQATTDQYPDLKVFIYSIDIPELDLLPGPVFDAFKGMVNRDELFAPFFIKPGEITKMDGPLEPVAAEE